MKILMLVRPNLYIATGGDTTQVSMTAEYLRKIGITVDIALSNSNPNLSGYDLLHFFNIIRPDDILPFVVKNYIPYVVSTIFVDYYAFESKKRGGILGFLFKKLNPGQIEYIKAIARWLKNGDSIKSNHYLFYGHKQSIVKIAKNAAMLLPNSESEYNRLAKYIKFKPCYKKIVNAIDSNIFYKDKPENLLYKNHVLCVGRIEGLKNQLNLIKALINTNMPLTIIGKPSINHLSYYMECKKMAATQKNIRFIGQISAKELASIYKAAKVHVLPSWFETTGLSSLEAGAMGCNVVITRNGDAEEYFKEMAYYCEPDDIDSIRHAVVKAYTDDVNKDLQKHILENYTWGKTAAQTFAAYGEVIDIKKKNRII